MKHYILTYSADHDPRVSHFLRGTLTPERVKKYTDVDLGMFRDFWVDRELRYVLSEPLWFVSREHVVDLDFYPALDGFIASDRMVNIINDKSNRSVSALPVQMIDESGNGNSAREMNFCQPLRRLNVCDLDRMDIGGCLNEELDSANKLSGSGGREVVCALNIVLRDDVPPFVKAIDIAFQPIIVSGKLAQRIEDEDLQGVRLIDTNDISVVDIMPNGPGGYIRTSPHWQLRSDLETWRRSNGLPNRHSLLDPELVALPPEIAAQIEAAKSNAHSQLEKRKRTLRKREDEGSNE